MREDELDRVCRQGTEAWRRLKRDKNWNDWLKVGEALQVGRERAMNQAMTNRPEGKAYNMAFGEWLRQYKLDDMDKGERSRLFAVMENLPMIEQWRQTLTLSERLKLNHPFAVLRKWKAAVAPEKPKDDKPTLRDSVANLSEDVAAKDAEIASLKAHIAELEAARDTAPAEERKPMFDANDPLKQIEQQQAQIAELGAASGKASVARAGLAGLLEALLERMNDKGFGERDVPDFVESKPAFEPLDLIELAKWIRDFADYWKRYQRKIAKQSVAAAK